MDEGPAKGVVAGTGQVFLVWREDWKWPFGKLDSRGSGDPRLLLIRIFVVLRFCNLWRW